MKALKTIAATAVIVMKQLEATGEVTYAYLGVHGQTITSDPAARSGYR
jgi:S1-C subfamily serine protease